MLLRRVLVSVLIVFKLDKRAVVVKHPHGGFQVMEATGIHTPNLLIRDPLFHYKLVQLIRRRVLVY